VENNGIFMFRGSSFHTIDEKGRIKIPTRFRTLLADSDSSSLMVSRMDKGLVAYTLDEWVKIETKILTLSEKSDSMRRFRRIFIGGAFDCTHDKQGRILIPPTLRQYAGLEKDIVLVGVLDHFEIWSRDLWEEENMRMEEDMLKEEVRNEIASLGL
jgi:MraZ protein